MRSTKGVAGAVAGLSHGWSAPGQLAAGGLAAAWLAGCAGSPLSTPGDDALRASVRESVARELREAEMARGPAVPPRQDRLGELEIRPRDLEIIAERYSPEAYRRELTGRDGAPAVSALLDENLYGGVTATRTVTLGGAIRTGLERNLDVQVASLTPAIRQAAVVEAEALFDWVASAGLQWQDTDTPAFDLSGNRVSNASQTVSGNAGLRRRLETGGAVSAGFTGRYTDQRDSSFGVSPPPFYDTAVVLGFEQPLLEGFGTDVNLAEIRLARNAEREGVAILRDSLIATLTEIETTYWQLALAEQTLIIRAKLLERGIGVREQVRARRIDDARQAQVADAVARVERRRGEVIRARASLRRLSNQLKALVNDPALPVGAEVLVLAGEAPEAKRLEISLADAIASAIANRPELERAVLNIDDATIREVVARNRRLPELALRAEATLNGLDADAPDALTDTFQTEFIDGFLLGLSLEDTVGGRRDEAAFRRSRLQRMQSVVAYRGAVQRAVLRVKLSLENVAEAYRLIEQARLSRIAQAEALRSLEVEKELIRGGITVERLNLELNQQEALAQAEIAEVRAIIDYNIALARLHEAMGTTLERNRIEFVVPDANQTPVGLRALDYQPAPDAPDDSQDGSAGGTGPSGGPEDAGDDAAG